jgi:peptidoglycan/LPS O-acetylase OafA/YrhL
MGPLRFWISCLAWAFWRWDSFKQGALSVFAFVLLVLPFATGLSSLKEAVPVWGAVVPVGVLVLLVAPYVKFRESERV